MGYIVAITILALVGIGTALYQFKLSLRAAPKLATKLATKSTTKWVTKQATERSAKPANRSKKPATPVAQQATLGRFACLQGFIAIMIYSFITVYLDAYPDGSGIACLMNMSVVLAVSVVAIVLYLAVSLTGVVAGSMDITVCSTERIVYILYTRNLTRKICLVLSGLLCIQATFVLLNLAMLL